MGGQQVDFPICDSRHEVYFVIRCKDYGILSVLFQLYTRPCISFKLPPTVFYPQPKVSIVKPS
jgi:hypothetical protein